MNKFNKRANADYRAVMKDRSEFPTSNDPNHHKEIEIYNMTHDVAGIQHVYKCALNDVLLDQAIYVMLRG